MSTFKLARVGAVDLEFDGEVVGEASSERPGKLRWMDVRVYRVAGEPARWVVERQGRTLVAGESEGRSHVSVCTTPEEVRKALESTEGGRTFTTDVCHRALRAAAAGDPDLADAAVERL